MSARFLSIILSLLACCASAARAEGVPAPSPLRWEEVVAAFEAADRANPPPAHAILFTGSSSIRLWTNLAESFPGWTTIRRGVGGAVISDFNHYFDRLVAAYRPAAVILYAGENDFPIGRSPEDVLREFKTFAKKVRTQLPGTPIYFLAMKLSPSRWYLSPQIKKGNELIRRYAGWHSKIHFIDVATPLLGADDRPNPDFFKPDMLHLNGRGYELWQREIAPAVKHR